MSTKNPASHTDDATNEPGSSTQTLPVIIDLSTEKEDDSLTVSILPREQLAPLEAATRITNGFVRMLQFDDQRTAVKEYSTDFIQLFSTYYYESKSILMARGDAAYCPKHWKVSISFQALDRIKESMACMTFARELASATEEMDK